MSVASAVVTAPFTTTRPAVIRASTLRLEAIPARARKRLSLIDLFEDLPIVQGM